MHIDTSRKVELPEHVMLRESAGEAVLLNINTEQYHGLDKVGLNFLNTLIAASSVSDALKILQADYDIDQATLDKDLSSFIVKLLDCDLLQYTSSES